MKYLSITISCLMLTCLSFKGLCSVSFSITGSITGLKNGSKLLVLNKRGNKIDTVSKAVAKNEGFVFHNVKLPVAPDFYLICIQTEFVENLNLFLGQEGDVKVTGILKSWPSVTVTGSKIYDDYTLARKIFRKVWDDEFVSKYPDGMAPSADVGLFYSKRAMDVVVNEIPDSYYIPVMIALWKHPASDAGYVVGIKDKKPFYDRLSETQKNSYYGKILGEQIEDSERSAKWMEKLKGAAEDLTSVTREEVVKQLSSSFLPAMILLPTELKKAVKLDEKEIVNKTTAATLIVNMAYTQEGVDGIQTNPTTAYVINENGIGVTNYHVFKEYAEKPYASISMMTAEGKTCPVTKVLSCSESDDLVVFQIDTKGEKLSALPLGNSAANGTAIYVMSHPMQNFFRFTSGVIAGNTKATLAGQPCDIMKITADFNVGSSGGPIVDGFGNVVGTVSRIDGSGAKVGIPVSALRKLIELK
jgi:serine protease Do